MSKIVLKNGKIINEGIVIERDILIEDGLISQVGGIIDTPLGAREINCEGRDILPGIIDDQVHDRDYTQAYKATVSSTSMQAVCGGVTSMVVQPNTNPLLTSCASWRGRLAYAKQRSVINYACNIGATDTNHDELARAIDLHPQYISGIKTFAGSSTGNMKVREESIGECFKKFPEVLHIVHSEDDDLIQKNLLEYQARVANQDDEQHVGLHPKIRNVQACFEKTDRLITLAKNANSRLHVYHVSTADELMFTRNNIPLHEKRITFEACIPHIFLNSDYYDTFGNLIKCNPAIKDSNHQQAIIQAIKDGNIDVVATDHAPHTWDEKIQPYFKAPSGVPSVQFSLVLMLNLVSQGVMDIHTVVRTMCHNPATLFGMKKRGFIKEGYHADIAIVEKKQWICHYTDLESKVMWSPFLGRVFSHKVTHTIVNGKVVYDEGDVNKDSRGMLLEFENNV